MARLPSGTLVEVLCGQPEQKYGVRCSFAAAMPSAGRSNASSLARRCSSAGLRWPSLRRRATTAAAIMVGVNSPSLGSNVRAGLVALADHRRPLRRIDVVENAQQLVLDEAALLLDHQHVLQAFGEGAGAGLLQRPGQRHLVDAQSERLGFAVGNAEIGQRLPQIEIGLAGRHDAEPRRLGIEHDAVETVDAGEGGDRVHLRAVQPALLLQRRIGPADAEPTRRHLEIVGHDDLDAIGIADDRGRALDRFRDRLEADPATGIARQRKAENAEIEIVLQRRGIDDRHQGRGEHLFALMGERRGLAAMVVAGQRDHAAVRRGAGRVGMLERIQRTVDAGALAVPDAEHAIDLGAGKHADLLAAPHRGRRQILVEARLRIRCHVALRKDLARHSAWSYMPSGEPR